MNDFEYKKAYKNIAPSEKLIKSTLLKIEKQKRNKIIKIQTYLQVAAAACFCVVVGISVSNIPKTSENANNFVGSIFGAGAAWVLAGLLFALALVVIIIISKRRK